MTELLAADSFRVRLRHGTAQVRGFSRHLARFASAALAEPTVDAQQLSAFLAESRHRIASFGEGFPRLELRRDPGERARLLLTLRTLPPLTEEIALRSAPRFQPKQPSRKGPDIEHLRDLNRRLHGEALLFDRDGHPVEGATTSIMWWGHESLHTVRSHRRVPSVTEALLRTAARASQTSMRAASPTLGLLAHSEVWAVNALHGLRVIRRIDDVQLRRPDTQRLTYFRSRLDATWEPVHDLGRPSGRID